MEIYRVQISDMDEETLNKLSLLIDLEKRNKLQKFVNKNDKIRTLIGDMLIRSIALEKLNISNPYITFGKNQYGKPYLKKHPDFEFNVSHSGNFVVCAVDDKSIGIDIEEIKDIEYEEIAKEFFSASELEYIVREDSSINLNKFYEIWTLKESYVKCCGKGLSISLKSFSIDIDKYKEIKITTNYEEGEHIFERFYIDSFHRMAVCSVNTQISKNIIVVDQNNLINHCLNFM